MTTSTTCTFVRDGIADDYSKIKVTCSRDIHEGTSVCRDHLTHIQVGKCDFSHGEHPQKLDGGRTHEHSFGLALCDIENVGWMRPSPVGRIVLVGPITCPDCNSRLQSAYWRSLKGAAPKVAEA